MFSTIKRAFGVAFDLTFVRPKKRSQSTVSSTRLYVHPHPPLWTGPRRRDPFIEKKFKANNGDDQEDSTFPVIPGGWPSDPITPDRPHNLQPKRQEDIRRNLSKTTTLAPTIIIETSSAENPLPANYSGTINGLRFYTPDEYTNDHKCGYIGEHKLTCGHWVKSALPCGSTCRDADDKNDALICPTCHAAIRDCVEHKLTSEEQEMLRQCMVNTALLTVKLVELATRYLPHVKGGITETVRCIVTHGVYGRPCEASMGPVAVMPMHNLAREVQKKMMARKMEREAPLIKHAKRTAANEISTPDATIETPLPSLPLASLSSPKKQKVNTHTITPIAGVKRRATDMDINTNTNTSPTSSSLPHPANTPSTPSSKRTKTVHFNVPSSAGTKRTSPPEFSNPATDTSAKRRRLTPPTFSKPCAAYAKPSIVFYGGVAICKRPNGGNMVMRGSARSLLRLRV